MPRRAWLWLALAAGACASSGKSGPALNVLPATASAQLQRSLDAARPHAAHVWRDMPPINPDGTVNAFVEIPLGERRKYEFDMAQNVRAVDRVMPESMGGYPVNYGFVPQTVSYDGDPFDVLVLGPPLPGGAVAKGIIVGLIVVRRPDPSRWDLQRLATTGEGEDLALAKQGLGDWVDGLEAEDRR